MKKVFLVVLIGVLGFSAKAQESNFGAGVGLPWGEAGDVFNFSTVIEWNYLWEVTEGFYIGPGLTLMHVSGDARIFGDSGVVQNVNTIIFPITLDARYKLSKKFTFGLDVGYAFSSSEETGLYFAPKLQYGISDKLSLVLSPRVINIKDYTFNTFEGPVKNAFFHNLTFGLEFKF